MSNRLKIISELLLEEIAERFDSIGADNQEKFEFSESFAEILDRFVVLHIRMWKLEDEAGVTTDDAQLGALKRKIDYCFKVRRPQLIKAINSYLDLYISKNHTRQFSEENVKLYKGF